MFKTCYSKFDVSNGVPEIVSFPPPRCRGHLDCPLFYCIVRATVSESKSESNKPEKQI